MVRYRQFITTVPLCQTAAHTPCSGGHTKMSRVSPRLSLAHSSACRRFHPRRAVEIRFADSASFVCVETSRLVERNVCRLGKLAEHALTRAQGVLSLAKRCLAPAEVENSVNRGGKRDKASDHARLARGKRAQRRIAFLTPPKSGFVRSGSS